jgi:hypothetical protein
MPQMAGSDLDGRKWNEARGNNMTVTEPPSDYRWHHCTVNTGMGNDEVYTEYKAATADLYREIRLSYLDQFELVISPEPEKGFRVWRWLGDESDAQNSYNGRSVRWSERRPWDSPLPKTPGLWPSNE